MDIRKALELVIEKYNDEQKGITTGKNAEQYKEFCKEYPLMMSIAHHIWTREITKNLNWNKNEQVLLV